MTFTVISVAGKLTRPVRTIEAKDRHEALAIAKRKGAGKLRHINVSALWIQDVQDREGAEYVKILGTENPADLMTKYLARDVIDKHMSVLGQVFQEGRAGKGLEMQKVGTA